LDRATPGPGQVCLAGTEIAPEKLAQTPFHRAAPTTMGLAVLATPRRMRIDLQNTVTLRAPGRLHLGFLDPSGSLGRHFGSFGLVLDGFETEIELSAALADRVTADTSEGAAQLERASAHLHTLRARTGRRETLHLRLLRVLPAHGGCSSHSRSVALSRAGTVLR
jgi:beta-ribofuranosylaminobenzene 5'-phosphate synthase